MNKKKLFIVALAFFLLVTLLVATPVLAGTAPPFDLYNAVMDIQNKSNWILGNLTNALAHLTAIQTRLTDLEMKLWSGSNSLLGKLGIVGTNVDSILSMLTKGGSFYDHVDEQFGTTNDQISDVKEQVQANRGLECVITKSGYVHITSGGEATSNTVLLIRTNATCQYTLTFWIWLPRDPRGTSSYAGVWAQSGGDVEEDPVLFYTPGLTDADTSQTITVASRQFQFGYKWDGAPAMDETGYLRFCLIGIGPPDTVVTSFYTDFPSAMEP